MFPILGFICAKGIYPEKRPNSVLVEYTGSEGDAPKTMNIQQLDRADNHLFAQP